MGRLRLRVYPLLLLISLTLIPQNVFALASSQTSQALPKLLQTIIACPNSYVSTPMGCVPRVCSFGPVVQFDSVTGDLTFENGTRIVVPAHCRTGFPVMAVTSVYSDGSNATKIVNARSLLLGGNIAPFPTNNWVEDAHYCNWFFVCLGLSSLYGSWTAPNAPINYNGQTIYLFDGLQDASVIAPTIIQPVLQYGGPNSCLPGGPYWRLASFLVNFSTCTYSQPLVVNPGDFLDGKMSQLGICGHTCIQWKILSYNHRDDMTTTLVINSDAMTDAYVTLEVYDVMNCQQYPGSQNTLFTNLSVGGGNPGWGAEVRQNDGCGEAVNIWSSSQVLLQY